MQNNWFVICRLIIMWFKNIIIVIIIVSGLSAFSYHSQEEYRQYSSVNMVPGEKMIYRVHYGIFNAAEGIMEIDRDIHIQNGRPCYKVDVVGNTVGLFDMILRIRDVWGSYIDTSAIIPHRSYRYIEEGRYRKYEIVDFNHFEENVEVTNLDKQTRKPKKKEKFDIPKYTQDVVSGYYYFRTFDYDTIDKNSIIEVDGFLEDSLYHLKVKFLGREKIKTKIGEFDALVIEPIMPKNKLFRGENAIKGWLSDDELKIPLKVKAEMFVGAVEVDITGYKHGDE